MDYIIPKNLTPEQQVTCLISMLLGIATAAKGSGLDMTIRAGLDRIAPIETAMIELKGIGVEQPVRPN